MLELAADSILFSLLPFLPHHLGMPKELIRSPHSFALSADLVGFVRRVLGPGVTGSRP